MRPHYLNSLFSPRSIAVFGASERPGSVGQVVLRNLLGGEFAGPVYALNTRHPQVQGQPAFSNLDAVGKPVDLAIIATPAKSLPAIIEDCGEHGVKSAIILSAEFSESGRAGKPLEDKVIALARDHGIRVLGPNCLGLIRPAQRLNATFGNNTAQPGKLALISQSGALCTAILDWADQRGIGFSAVVSTGISADLDFGDILEFLMSDPHTHSILLYIEGLRDVRRFMTGLRLAARAKPVIAIKVGRHTEGARASLSHSGALVGADEAFSAALARCGVVRVETIAQLFSAASTLSSRYRECGKRLAVVTNGGGPGVLAADHIADYGLELATLDAGSVSALKRVMPKTWSRGNPVGILGDAGPQRYTDSVNICLQDQSVDGVIVILTPQAVTQPLEVAEELAKLLAEHRKPVFTVWMGGAQVEPSRELFRNARIPTYSTPESAVDAIHYLSEYQANQRQLLEVPATASTRLEIPDIESARMIIEGALAQQRKTLSEPEAMALLNAFQIPTVRNSIARSATEALVAATAIGYPVAMKIYSPDISHKTDVGGVRLNLSSAAAVRSCFREMTSEVAGNSPEAKIEGVTIEQMYSRRNGRELMVGIVNDPVFGPIINFGSGGSAVEVLQDYAVSLPPLNRHLAGDLIRRTRAARMLGEFRRMPAAHLEALIDVLLRISAMACELPWLQELDINPLILDEHGAVAVDARIRIDFHTASSVPYHHMAIHPYPSQLVQHLELPEGRKILIRPIRPEDAVIEQEFVRRLSSQTKYFRFMQSIHELTPQMLTRFTQIDYDQEMALIAISEDEDQDRELAVARYVTNSDGVSCEFALVVSDELQQLGIGHRLMEMLIGIAHDRGLKTMEGEVLSANTRMLQLMRSLGFQISNVASDVTIKAVSKPL